MELIKNRYKIEILKSEGTQVYYCNDFKDNSDFYNFKELYFLGRSLINNPYYKKKGFWYITEPEFIEGDVFVRFNINEMQVPRRNLIITRLNESLELEMRDY